MTIKPDPTTQIVTDIQHCLSDLNQLLERAASAGLEVDLYVDSPHMKAHNLSYLSVGILIKQTVLKYGKQKPPKHKWS